MLVSWADGVILVFISWGNESYICVHFRNQSCYIYIYLVTCVIFVFTLSVEGVTFALISGLKGVS